MKIRSGFVSNSSSSSFVAFVPTSVDVFKNSILDEKEIEIFKEAFLDKYRKRKFLGHDVLVFEGYSGDDGCHNVMDLDSRDLEQCIDYDKNNPWKFANKIYTEAWRLFNGKENILFHNEEN